jgi:hypothetical protein
LSDLVNLLGLIVGLPLLGASIAALLVLIQALFPGTVLQTRRTVERMPIRAFFVGLVNFLFFGLLGLAVAAAGVPGTPLLGSLIGLLLLSVTAAGLAAVARLVGDRLQTAATPPPVRSLLLGTLVLEGATLVPLVGWVVVPVLASLCGLGAVIITVIRRQPDRSPLPSALRPEAGAKGDEYEPG